MFSIGTTPPSNVAPLDRGDHVGNRSLCGALARGEVVLGEQRLLREGARRPEIRNGSHRRDRIRARRERPRRHATRVPIVTGPRQLRQSQRRSIKEAAMRAAVFAETGGPLTIEDLEPGPAGPRDVVVELGASGVCHSDLSLKNGYVGIMPGTVLGHEGAGTVARGRQRGHARSRRATTSSPRSSRRAAPAGSACTTSRTSATTSSTVMMAMRGNRPDGSRVHGDDRPRHVRRGDDVQRGVDRQGRDRRPRRAARADRLRRHHRRRRRAQHRRGAAGLDRRGHRLRRRRPVRHPGRAHRRRGRGSSRSTRSR